MDNSTHTKTCRKCGVTKPLNEFGIKRSAGDGLQSRCKPCIKEDKRISHGKNRDAALARSRAGYLANRESRIAAAIQWKQANPEKVRGYRKIGYSRNPQRDLDNRRRWMAANPERESANNRLRLAVRRARKRGASIGPVDLDALWESQGEWCPLCGAEIDRSLTYPDPLSQSVDHIVPLAKGGTHEQSNLQWTHLVCNNRKGARAS